MFYPEKVKESQRFPPITLFALLIQFDEKNQTWAENLYVDDVAVKAKSNDREPPWLIAAMTFDIHNDMNIVSRNFVVNRLQADIQLHDNRGKKISPKTSPHGFKTQGYIDLDWAFTDQVVTVFSSKFQVTASHDSPFDIILGLKTIQDCGLVERIE